MAPPPVPKPAVLAVSTGLREARERRKVGVRELARTLGIAPASLSNWETGTNEPKPTIAARVLGSLHVDGSEFDELMEISTHLHARNLVDHSSSSLINLLWAYENLASRIVEWAPFVLPDVLQKPVRSDTALTKSDRMDQEAFCRRVRQESLTEGNRQYVFLIGEHALGSDRDDSDLAEQQMAHLRALAALRHITIRVVPSIVAALQSVSAFTLFEHGSAFAVALKHTYCCSYLTDKELVRSYHHTASALQRRGVNNFMTLEAWSGSAERKTS